MVKEGVVADVMKPNIVSYNCTRLHECCVCVFVYVCVRVRVCMITST